MEKKIVTAKEQWEADLRKCVAENGDIDHNPETYKVVDDGIGLNGDNELYHLANDEMDYFFLKVGEEYSKVSTWLGRDTILWNNSDKLDLTQSWFDLRKVMEWLKNSDEDNLDGCPIQFYELIWMGIYDKDAEGMYIEKYLNYSIYPTTENNPSPEIPKTEEKSKMVEDIVQDFRDALEAQKKVVWRMICNRFEKAGKNIDMERMPECIADSCGYQFCIQDCGHLFAIATLEGVCKILYRPEGYKEAEQYLDWKEMSYEALLDIFYAMA